MQLIWESCIEELNILSPCVSVKVEMSILKRKYRTIRLAIKYKMKKDPFLLKEIGES